MNHIAHCDIRQDAIVISMTDLSRFKRCRKSSDLTFHHGLEPLADREAMANGRAFHAILEAYALSITGKDPDRYARLKHALGESELGIMKAVAEQYITRKWNVAADAILNIEEPVYTLLLDKGAAWNGKHDDHPSPGVYLRTTFDMIYRDDNAWFVGREYKTFQRNVTSDNDLDFQGKIEMAVMQLRFDTRRARFEYINVRQTPPDVVKDQSGGRWREDECYTTNDFYPSDAEIDSIWAETRNVARDLLGCLASDDPYVWYRTDLKGNSPHTCGTCLVKNLCKAEAMFGGLSADTIEMYAKVRHYERAMIVSDAGGPAIAVVTEPPREFTPVHLEEV